MHGARRGGPLAPWFPWRVLQVLGIPLTAASPAAVLEQGPPLRVSSGPLLQCLPIAACLNPSQAGHGHSLLPSGLLSGLG